MTDRDRLIAALEEILLHVPEPYTNEILGDDKARERAIEEAERVLERAKKWSGICEDCRWWGEKEYPQSQDPWGKCQIDCCGYFSDIICCSFKFGCIHFEPREEADDDTNR